MTNPYYNETFTAAIGSQARSRAMDREFEAIERGFDLLSAAVSSITVAQQLTTVLTGLTDFPASYVGHALKHLRVNITETGIEFVHLGQMTIKTIGGTSYTLEAADSGKKLIFTNDSAVTVTVPKNAVVAFQQGTTIPLMQYGLGTVTVAPVDGDVAVGSSGGLLSTRGRYAGVALCKDDTNTWTLIGDRLSEGSDGDADNIQYTPDTALDWDDDEDPGSAGDALNQLADRLSAIEGAIIGGGIGDALTSDGLDQFAATTSAQLRGVISDETGTGALVFGTAPTLSNPVVGTQAPGDNSTKAASTAYADAAVGAAMTALKGDAGAALDTLGELSDAIADNADFAGAMTTALAAKAPLASPALTGNPTAPTQSPADNSTKIATTAYVDAAAAGAGVLGVPQNAQPGNYTLVIGDNGKHIFHAAGSGSGHIWTIPANASVAFPIGAAVTFVNKATDSVTIAITTDTLTHTDGTTGSLVLPQNGITTALKVGTTEWQIGAIVDAAAVPDDTNNSAQLRFTSDTGSTADSDPGSGLFKWNNATQGSATVIFIDDNAMTGQAVTAFMSALEAGGYLFIQQLDDDARWQKWRITSIVDAAGYTKFGVSLLANGSDIQDDKSCFVSISTGVCETWAFACSDYKTTALAAATDVGGMIAPYAAGVINAWAGLHTAQASGTTLAVDVNEAGTTILSTKLTIDNTEQSSHTAAAQPVISDPDIAAGAKITADIDALGDGTAKGLTVYLRVWKK